MRKEAPIYWFFVLLLGWIPVAGGAIAQAPTADPHLRSGLEQLAAGAPDKAHRTLQALIDNQPAPAVLVPALIANGKALAALDRFGDACEQYEQALAAAPATFDRSTLRLVAADAALRSKQPAKAVSRCDEVLSTATDSRQRLLALRIRVSGQVELAEVDAAWQTLQSADPALAPSLCDLANRVGAAALSQTQPKLAERVYAWMGQNTADEALQRKSQLGLAWAAALGAKRPAEAAALLRAFAIAHPTDADALRALRAEAACWRQAGDAAKAEQTLTALLKATQIDPASANSPVAIAALAELSLIQTNHRGQGHPETGQRAEQATKNNDLLAKIRKRFVAEGLLRGNDPATSGHAITILPIAISDAAAVDDEDYWSVATDQAIQHANSQPIVARTLASLSAAGHDAHAERLAAVILGAMDATKTSAPASESLSPSIVGACEAACRWAAESGRWTMLALAAESADAKSVTGQLSPTSTRLLSEALIQTKRSQVAKTWFDAAVAAGANDFVTLVRRAELSVALDDMAVADANLKAAAEHAAAPAQFTLIEVLMAELAIRRARLDEARVMLQRIVRLDSTDAAVRCRAQWLIGETFLLQEKYAEAIDAYRLVESYDTPAGHWTAVALVQAGKSFEKMGRPRDAATCYGGLLQRFADSEHALVARDRLAVIRDGTRRR